MKDFFISYNSADRPWAVWIAWQLEEAGYTTVLQAWDFPPGSNFVLEMDKAAKEAQRTIAVLSQAYLDASFTPPEWAAAFAKDPKGEQRTLVPVRVRECDLAGLLAQVVYIDLVGLDEASAKHPLLAGVSRGRAKPAAAPAFPGTPQRSVPERPPFPGGLPPVWNLPHRRNPNFTGRKSLLSDLRRALTSGKPAALTQAVYGLGGVGKTELAVEYAYCHAGDYGAIWWVRAEEPAQLASDYAALAQPLGLPESDAADQPIIIEAVTRWLGQNGGWLVVFDNVGEPSDIRAYLPQACTGHVIITSRNPNWLGDASPLQVDVLTRPESVRFLVKRTAQKDRKAAGALAEALGDLPLALEQAGAYIEEGQKSLSDYLDLFGSRQAELLAEGVPATGYQATVATTWDISLQAAREKSPAAPDLLNLCAFLAPDDIPLDVISGGSDHLPESLEGVANDPLAFNDAVAALRRYSLAEVGDKTLSVHRLVQSVVRDRLAEDGQKAWAQAAVCVVKRAFPLESNDVRVWPTCARLLSHGLAAAGHAETLTTAAEPTCHLLNEIGVYVGQRGQLRESKAAHERALALAETLYGPDHLKVARCLHNFGRALHDLADLSAARSHIERAIRIVEATHGPDNPDLASYINSLGMLFHDLGDQPAALALYRRALDIRETAYGLQHPKVAIIVNNIGSLLWDMGDLEGARTHLERALSIMEASYGCDHPEVALCLHNLGAVLDDIGDLEGALACGERALKIHEAAYGPNHPDVATDLNGLGLVLQDLGDLEGARAHHERALEIDEAIHGPNHPVVATDLSNLGRAFLASGDVEGARAQGTRALRILRQSLGDDHPDTIKARRNLESLGA